MSVDLYSLLFIPHILHDIAQYLTPHELQVCQSVSRRWKEIFTPVVWRVHEVHITDGDLDPEGEDGSLRVSRNLDSLAQIAPHVREVSIRLKGPRLHVLSVAAAYLPHIQLLRMRFGSSQVHWVPFTTMVDASFPHLVKLHIRSGNNIKGFISAISGSLFARQLREMSYKVAQDYSQPSSLIVKLLLCLPSLEWLELGSRYCWLIDYKETRACQQRFSLRYLEIFDTPGYSVRPKLIIPLWKLCPFIKEFTAPWRDPDDCEAFVAMFDDRDAYGEPQRYHKELWLGCSEAFSDSQMIRVFRGCVPRQLTHLEMGCHLLLPNVIQTLLETQAESLQGIIIDDYAPNGADPSPLIQQILVTCPNLRQIHARGWGPSRCTLTRNTTAVYLRVDDIISGQWICHGLEDISIPIVCTPSQLNVVSDGNGAQESMVEQAMRQLGQMTRLKYLMLKCGTVLEDGKALDSIPFLLGPGGLQYLSGLTKLRHLDMTGWKHKPGVPEVMWMAEHWPNSISLAGLPSEIERAYLSHSATCKLQRQLG